jgi:hypothetical protein
MTDQRADQQKRDPDRLPDEPDVHDPTNASPYPAGRGSPTGLGGAGDESAGGGVGPDVAGAAVPEAVTSKSPGMSNAGPAAGASAGASDPAARMRGASARSVGGTGTAGPGSDVTDDDDAGK